MDSDVRLRLNAVASPAIIAVLDSPAAFLIARLLIAAPFLGSGMTKLLEWRGAEVEMIAAGLHPAWLFTVLTVATQLAGSALLIGGRWVWLGAGALGVFTAAATLIAHAFWTFGGPDRAVQMNIFLEHGAICGGLVAIAVVAFRRGAWQRENSAY